MQKDIPPKKILETLSFVLPAKITVLHTIRPSVVLAGKTKLRVSKNFFGESLFVLLNIFVTAAPKSKQKILKIIVQFSYCKPP